MSDNVPESSESKLLYGNPHDRFGRKTLGDPEIAADFLRCYADPMVGRHVNLDRLVPDATQFFGHVFRQVVLDVPYLARLRDGSGDAEVLIVFEHKSSPSVFTVLQLNVYANLSIYDKWIKAGRPRKNFKPPIPLMVVVYCGEEDWNEEICYQDMFGVLPEEFRELVPQHRVLGINLNRFGYDNLPGNPETQAVAESMKRAFDGSFAEHLEDILRRFASVPIDRRIEDLIVSICAYGVLVSDVTEEQIDKAISNTIQGPEGIHVAETARESIWQKGVEVGEVRGKAEAILAFLHARFKGVPVEATEALCKMTDATALDSLAALAATCDSVEEFAEALK